MPVFVQLVMTTLQASSFKGDSVTAARPGCGDRDAAPCMFSSSLSLSLMYLESLTSLVKAFPSQRPRHIIDSEDQCVVGDATLKKPPTMTLLSALNLMITTLILVENMNNFLCSHL